MDDNLLNEAHHDVTTAMLITGQDQMPEAIVHQAALLLVDLWTASQQYGVTPADWAATSARLPKVCVDVLVAVRNRPHIDPNGG